MGAHLLWSIVIGFLAGVFLRSFLPLGFAFVGFLALLGAASFALAYIEVSKRRVSLIAGIGLLACAGGVARMGAAKLVADPALAQEIGKEALLEGFVFAEPDAREASVRIPIRLESGAGVLAIAPAHADVSYGDIVRVRGTLRYPESFEVGAGLSSEALLCSSEALCEGEAKGRRKFNYPAYLAKDGIGYEVAFVKEIEDIGDGARNPIKAAAIWIKQKFLEGLGRALPEPAAGLAGGITVGDKRGLGSKLSDVFRTVGLVHIIVLSGYNIVIVMEGLSRVLGWFSASRYVRLGTVVIVAIFFSLMTGLASASVRAAAMAIISVVGRMSGRMYIASRALALVAAGMVLWNPWILAYDPGFQLSVLATAGLIAFTPIVITRLKFITPKLGLREIAATTIGTQLAVLPLLLYQSGSLSLVALPVNLLALIVVPYAMLASLIAGVGGLILGPLAPIVSFPAYLLLSYILLVAEWMAQVPFSSVSIVAFPAALLVISYVVLFTLVRLRTASRSRPNSNS